MWSVALSLNGENVASASQDKFVRVWQGTDEPVFLIEQDRRIDEMFKSTLIDEDIRNRNNARAPQVTFLHDSSAGEAKRASRL